MEPKLLSRVPAQKITIGEVNSGEYVQDNEQNLSCLITADGRKIYRLNLLAIIVNKDQQGSITNFMVDDGTGKTICRMFEDNDRVNSLTTGDSVIIIGKVRKYNQETYIAPEIIKKIDPQWLKLRREELKEQYSVCTPQPKIEETEIKEVAEIKVVAAKKEVKPLVVATTNEEEAEIAEEEVTEGVLLPNQKILHLIKELDTGSGVAIEDIIIRSVVNDTEKIIEKMLEKGEIFQNLPGKVKVL